MIDVNNAQVYDTQNRSLAIALHFGGVPLIDVWRIGNVTVYYHEDNAHRKDIERAFDSVADAAKVDLPTVSNEDAAKLAHLVLQFRAQIVDWLRDPASEKILTTKGNATISTETMPDGRERKIVTHPGLTCHSANASKTIIDHLEQ